MRAGYDCNVYDLSKDWLVTMSDMTHEVQDNNKNKNKRIKSYQLYTKVTNYIPNIL